MAFRVEPSATQVVTADGAITYRIVVDRKGILNAGVEFEACNIPAGLTVTFDGARIAETARETQMTARDARHTPRGHFPSRSE